jgi:fructose-1,6-bisphosphatase/inositol monophosphatase family enzyme
VPESAPSAGASKDDVVLVAGAADEFPLGYAAALAPARRFRALSSIAYRLALVAGGDARGAVSLNGPESLDNAAAMRCFADPASSS